MSLFSIRVELHNATWAQYSQLADQLQKLGVVDTIVGDNRVRYKLPPGEYNYEGNGNIDQVHDAVLACANNTGCRNAVFVSEATRRRWSGLEIA